MKKLLVLNSGPHSDASHGYRLVRQVIGELAVDSLEITERDLVKSPIPTINREYAVAVTSGEKNDSKLFDISERLISELENHDFLIIVTPMHNLTVPAALKLWIDHVLRINRSFTLTAEGKIGLIKDRPTFVIVSSGGFHSGPSAKQTDFLTPYFRSALATIGITNVQFILLQGLAFGTEAVARAVEEAHRSLLEKLSVIGESLQK
jgi:FMN-dependent NADH-azoreductase